MYRRWICLLLTALFVTSCGYSTGVIQNDEAGYIKFTGNWKNASIKIDESEPFELKYYHPEENINDEVSQNQAPVSPAKVYLVSPGNHLVKVYNENGELAVKRKLFIGNQQTMEVRIP